MSYFADHPSDLIDQWTSSDGTTYAYGRARPGTDSELSNGADTYAHTYAARPGALPQGDHGLTGRIGQPGIEHGAFDNITVITDFPAFVEVTGYPRSAEVYLAEVADYYRAWSEGKQYVVEINGGDEISEFVESGVVDRAYIERYS